MQVSPLCAAMPLSTAQALAKWEGVVSMLATEKARAAARLNQAWSPAGLLAVAETFPLASQGLATPARTWKALLQKQVQLGDGAAHACDVQQAVCPFLPPLLAVPLHSHCGMHARAASGDLASTSMRIGTMLQHGLLQYWPGPDAGSGAEGLCTRQRPGTCGMPVACAAPNTPCSCQAVGHLLTGCQHAAAGAT